MSLPTKRSTFSAASASDDSSYSSPPMKKAKNDLHHSPQHPNTADKVVGFHMEEDPTPAAANLSRKKATLPQPTKKFVIKLNKAKPTLPTNFEENTWEKLQSAIRAIFLKKKISFDLESLYQAVDNLCLHKLDGKLYDQIEKECEEHISAALQSLVGQNTDLTVFLSRVEKCWQDFCDQMLMIRSIALTLDRKYVIQNPNVRSLWEMGLQLFRKHLSLAPEVEQRTVKGLLSMIEKERLAEAVNRTLLSHLLKMFTALGIYMESFEKPFLEGTSEFYAAEGMKYMQQSDVPEYLKHVEGRLHEENERCILYIDAVTRKPLITTVERQLLERHILVVLEKGFTTLMDGRRTEDLQRMQTLFSRVNALESLRQALSSYVRQNNPGTTTSPNAGNGGTTSSIRSQVESTDANGSPTTLTAQPTNSDSVPGQTTTPSEQEQGSTITNEPVPSDTSVYTRTTTSEYTLTSSGSVVVITSLVTAVITGSDPSQSGGGSGSRSLNGSNGTGGNSFFSNTGATAGTFVVVGLVAAGIAIGLGFFFVRRKRARKLDEDTRIAAGGAGNGGAGRNRFEDEDDDSIVGGDGGVDPFGGNGGGQEMSEGHHSSGYMSSYGSMLPLVAGAGSYGHGQRPHSGHWEGSTPGLSSVAGGGGGRYEPNSYVGYSSPAQSSGSIPYQLPSFGGGSGSGSNGVGPTYPAGAGVGFGYGAGAGNARSHEGALHDDWAEYVNDGPGARSTEGPEGPFGSSNSHSREGHSPGYRDSGESYYGPSGNPDPESQNLRNSLYGGLANEPSQPLGGGGRTVDDRLNPDLLGGDGMLNDRAEAASLADDHDYSRRILRVANPSDASSMV